MSAPPAVQAGGRDAGKRMLNYFLKRLLGLIPTLLIVAVLVFLFVHLLPGDPARLIAGPEADAKVVELVRRCRPEHVREAVGGVLHQALPGM